MDDTPRVLFVGLSTVDLIYRVDRMPGGNEKAVALDQEVCAGGPATNAAVACSHLGGPCVLASAIGTHPLGSLVREDLARHGVEVVDLASGLALAPPVSSVLVHDRTGERAVVSTNASRWTERLAPIPDGLIEGAGLLLLDGHHMAAAIEAARRARACGVRTVLDGGSWKPGTDLLLDYIDFAICSADFRPPGCDTPGQALAFLAGRRVRGAAITRGSAPTLVRAARTETTIDVPGVQVVDTLGAGDILHGAFCHHLVRGEDFLGALTAATRVATLSCAYRGTREWMRHVRGSEPPA